MSEAGRVPRSPLALLLVATWALPVGAQPAEEAVRFQYGAPPECPDAQVFTARVRERTQRGRQAAPEELARTFNVEIAPQADGFSGAIEFLDDAGLKVNRRLHDEQCDAVVSSLALVTALALDATLRQDDTSTEPQPAPPVALASVAPPPAAPAMPVRLAPARVASAPRLIARVGFSGAYSSVLHDSQPGLSPQLGLLGQLESPRGWALRLLGHRDEREFTVDEGRRAKLRIVGIESSLCPWQWRWDAVGLLPCAVVDFGSLHGEGELGDQLKKASGSTIVWASVGGEGRLIIDPPTLPFWLELRAGAIFPLTAHGFEFHAPPALVYKVPRFAFAGGLAFGVRF